MFPTSLNTNNSKKEPSSSSSKISPKYKGILNSQKSTEFHNTTEKNKINELLEQEKQSNKTESWNKLDKMTKIQKLSSFADKYCLTNNLTSNDNSLLKQFFIQCIDQSKLIKSKEIVYDRETMEIKEIPALFLHPVHRNFTLRLVDTKRVSTLKSLAPKKRPLVVANTNPVITEKNEENNDIKSVEPFQEQNL